MMPFWNLVWKIKRPPWAELTMLPDALPQLIDTLPLLGFADDESTPDADGDDWRLPLSDEEAVPVLCTAAARAAVDQLFSDN